MSFGFQQQVAENVKRFRANRNLSQKQLAEASGVELEQIVELENGEGELLGSATVALANFFNVPIDDFTYAERTLRSVRFRAMKSMKPGERGEVVETCARWLDHYCQIEEWLNEKTFFDASRFGTVQNGDVPAYAANVRAELGISRDGPIVSIGDVLQRSRVKYWFCNNFGESKLFGLSVAETPQATAIIVNNDESISVERRIFSAVHEFAHLLLHSESFNGDEWKEDETEEKEADLFAGHFLMPNDAFRRSWNETFGETFDERVLSVKRFFRVSYKTVLTRLAENSGKDPGGYFAGFYAAYANTNKGARLAKKDEPDPLLKSDAPPDRYRSLVYRAFKDGVISTRKAAIFLNKSYWDFYTGLSDVALDDADMSRQGT